MKTLRHKILHKEAQVAIVGLGYVGLPMSALIAEAGFRVVGIDVDEDRVRLLNEGHSSTGDVPDERLRALIRNGLFTAVVDATAIRECDVVLICVPTPIDRAKEPDMTCIEAATCDIAANLRSGQLIILESTTYPGTTEEILRPALERDGMKAGEGFFLAFSPERLDPGNRKFTLNQVPKIVGGVTANCTEVATAFYQAFMDRVISVSSATTAEMVKIYENVFRNINIAFANEVALLCERMGLDVWEIIGAAASKPYGFMPFYPGPGLGGHCIPVDPYYLSWKARQYDFHVRFIELAASINHGMPYHVVSMVAGALNSVCKSIKSSNILVLGVAYKKDIGDTRESPALRILDLLREQGAEVSFSDPHVPTVVTEAGIEMQGVALSHPVLEAADCIVLITDHTSFDYSAVLNAGKPVVDTRNALKSRDSKLVFHM